MPKLTAAQLAAAMRNDNRTAVASPTFGATGATTAGSSPDLVYVGSVADDFFALGPTGATTDAVNATMTGPTGSQVRATAAYATGPTGPTGPTSVRILLDVATTGPTGTTAASLNAVTRNVRTQWFHVASQGVPASYDATRPGFGAKLCYVNQWGQPLSAAGVATTVALAVDARTTALTTGSTGATGVNPQTGVTGPAGPVTNYAQKGPLPGVYDVDVLQAGYAPYVGWTVQHT